MLPRRELHGRKELLQIRKVHLQRPLLVPRSIRQRLLLDLHRKSAQTWLETSSRGPEIKGVGNDWKSNLIQKILKKQKNTIN